MARIIVTTEQSELSDAPVLLDERVCSDTLTRRPLRRAAHGAAGLGDH